MTVIYIVSTFSILIAHISEVPAAIALIVDSAFNGLAATGGFAGSTLILALRMGLPVASSMSQAWVSTNCLLLPRQIVQFDKVALQCWEPLLIPW